MRTLVYGINNFGEMVGTSYVGSSYFGFLDVNGNFTAIDVPGSLDTTALGINDEGQIVGAFTDSSDVTHGFLLSDDTYITLDGPGSYSTVAWGINDAGQIVGEYNTPTTPLPGTLPLFVSGLGALGLLARRRRRKAQTWKVDHVGDADSTAELSLQAADA